MWKACPKCQALCPDELRFCPNCASRGSDWQRWIRGAVSVAGIGVIGFTSACVVSPISVVSDSGIADSGQPDSGTPDAGTTDSGSPDSGVPDSGTPDSGPADAGLQDAGDIVCICPVLAAYGNFGPCDGQRVASADAGCPGGGVPMCQPCPP